MPQRLSDLDGKEVSLVGRAANRRRFLVLKSATGEAQMDEVKALQHIEAIDKAGLGEAVEALTAADSELAASVLSKAAMTDEEKRKVKAALRVLGPEVAKKLPGFLRAAGMHEDEEEKPPMKKSDEQSEDKPEVKPTAEIKKNADGTWDLSALPDSQRPAFEAVIKAQEADSAKLRDELKKAADAAKASDEKLATIQAEKERAEMITKAAEFRDLPGASPDDMGPILIKIRKALETAEFDKVFAMLKASALIVRKSALFGEIGSGDQGGTSAKAEANRKAEELRKHETGLSLQQARAKVYKSDPALMERVNAEEAEQRQRARE